MKNKFLYLCIIISTVRCGSHNNKPTTCSSDITLKNFEKIVLKANSSLGKFHQKVVLVEGILFSNPEDLAIYPSKNSPTSEALWLSFNMAESKKMDSILRSTNGSRVLLKGKLNIANKGHLDEYKGTLENITVICR